MATRTFALALAIGCLGCSTPKVKVVDAAPPSERIGKYAVLHLDLRCSEPDGEEVVSQLRGALVAKMAEKSLFRNYVTTPDSGDADLRMVAVVTGIRKVGQASRVLFGAMAGKARLHLTVDLEDIKEGRVIAQFGVEGKSSGGSVYAGTTPEAVDFAARGVADYLERHR